MPFLRILKYDTYFWYEYWHWRAMVKDAVCFLYGVVNSETQNFC